MGFYAKHILPHVIDLAMRNPAATRLRAEWIPRATGDVLEVGIGSGLNLPFYTDRVRRVYGLDPSSELQQMARRRAAFVPFQVELIRLPAEAPIPLRTASIDTVVVTFTLCSMENPILALKQIRRVMRPDSRLVFIEHGNAPDASVQGWQDRLTPMWKLIAGGCHLNRPIKALIEQAEFHIPHSEAAYLPGPRFATYTTAGIAQPCY